MVVLIDADNTQLSKLEDILHDVSSYGRIISKKAYGNWKKPQLAKWEDEIKRLAIKAEQQFDYVSGKNTTDIAMVIDAMDMLHTGMYDAMVLVSSDSDFTPLAVRLRESGVYVIGVGEKKTPESFSNACDSFLFIEYITSGEKNGKSVREESGKSEGKDARRGKSDPEIAKLHDLLAIAYVKYQQEDDDYVNVSIAGTYIKRVMPEFNINAYGYKKLSDFISSFPERYEMRKEKKKGGAPLVEYRCV